MSIPYARLSMSLVVRTVFLEHAFTELPHVLKEYVTVNYRKNKMSLPARTVAAFCHHKERPLFFVVFGSDFASRPASS
jgi:hypothetical protein